MDPIRSYLKDIKNIPLLTAEEEVDLAKKIKRGDKLARAKMIQSNLRLVINIAKRYSGLGVSILDLIEEGNMGLMKAVGKFNHKRGYRFSTYAAWWIRQYISRSIANHGKTVRIPVYITEMMSRFKKTTEHLTSSFKRKPRLSEISKKMRLPMKRVKLLHKMMTGISSLNAPIGEEGSSNSISFATVTPSLVTVGEPNFLSMTTLRPFGPSVATTAFESLETPRRIACRAASSNINCLAAIYFSF